MADTTKPETKKTIPTTPSQALETTRRSDKQELARYNYDSPFSFMRRFMNDVDALFGGYGNWTNYGFAEPRLWTPQIDVLEKDGQLVLHADLPGTREQDIKIRVDDGVLNIAGERTNEYENDENGVHRRERSFGSFSRSVVLPDGVDPEAIQASFDNGVLEVTVPIPKGKAASGHAVPIRAKAAENVKH